VTQYTHHAIAKEIPTSTSFCLVEAYLTNETTTNNASFKWRTSEPIETIGQDDEPIEITFGVLKGNLSLLIRTESGTVTQFSQWVESRNSYLDTNSAVVSGDTITVPVPAELQETITGNQWTADLYIDGQRINSATYSR